MQRYQNDYFYYIRKPHGIASSFWGNSRSFLEECIATQSPEIQLLQTSRADHPDSKELGLINRLDTVTAWLLFFAKNQIIYHHYKKLQSEHRVQKIYYADCYGDLTIQNNIQIETPIYHHYSDPSRMTIDLKVSRGKAQIEKTMIEPLYYDAQSNSSTCKITIQKGIRHQIRIHCASIGHHIIGEQLYCPKWLKQSHIDLHLRSAWLLL